MWTACSGSTATPTFTTSGYISACGHTDFNLPIRTLYHDGSTFYLHSGSGIVADSDPAAEWDEVQVKVDNIRRLLAAT